MDRSDIYRHLKHGGDIETLYESLQKEIDRAQARIEEENAAEAAKKQAEEEKAVAYATAATALENYLAIAAPSVDKKIVPILLDCLGNKLGGFICGGSIDELPTNPFSWLFK